MFVYFRQLTQDPKRPYHCPYNHSHTMPHKTLLLHLGKCPDKSDKFGQCEFNALHVVLKSELQVQYNTFFNCNLKVLFTFVFVTYYTCLILFRPIWRLAKTD